VNELTKIVNTSWEGEQVSTALWRRIRRHVETGRETPKVDLKLTLQLSGKGESEFVKDVTAIANTTGGEGYLIIGVQDIKDRKSNDPSGYVIGFSTPSGSDQFERTAIAILTKFCSNVPTIQYDELTHPDCDKTIGVVTIRRSSQKPHSLIRASGEIKQHEVWIRRGTASYVATPAEIVAMTQTQDLPASIVVNLSGHPLTDEQRSEIEQRTYIEEEINEPAHCTPTNATKYIQNLFHRIGLTLEEWNTKSIILVLPGLAPLAANVLAHVHGIKGGFPKVLWLAPHPDDRARYTVGSIVDLQAIRDHASERRATEL
jgi:Putative DNA-binding domain